MMVEVLSRALNNLFTCVGFQRYEIPKWSKQINHLVYADDTIIFVKAYNTILELLMQTLKEYKEQSGQKINKEKRAFYVYHKAAQSDINRVEAYMTFTEVSSL